MKKRFGVSTFQMICFLVIVLLSAGIVVSQYSGNAKDAANAPTTQNAAPAVTAAPVLAPLPLKLPAWRMEGTPQNLPDANLDPNASDQPRPPFMAPKGVTNVALHKKVTSSDSNPIVGSLDLVTDGDKEALEGSWVELAEGKQWVQIDLAAEFDIYAIVFWHRHDDTRVYHDVVVQVSDDPKFSTGVTTLFNSDQANDLGLGAGKDFEYLDSAEGKLVDAKKTTARYVRLYSKGSTTDAQNHYTEVEVYALPVAK